MTIDELRGRTAVSVKTAADMLDIHPQMVYAAINRGQLKAKRIPGRDPSIPGKAIRIDVTALLAWFDSLDDAQDTA